MVSKFTDNTRSGVRPFTLNQSSSSLSLTPLFSFNIMLTLSSCYILCWTFIYSSQYFRLTSIINDDGFPRLSLNSLLSLIPCWPTSLSCKIRNRFRLCKLIFAIIFYRSSIHTLLDSYEVLSNIFDSGLLVESQSPLSRPYKSSDRSQMSVSLS